MATGSLYGSVSESTGLYGIGAASGGTYFEWFIFQDSATAPATPTGGSWSFSTNTGTAPTGWLNAPPAAPVNQVWVSITIVDSRDAATFTWSVPGLMTGSGLPILSASGVPSAGTGLNGQLYIDTATTPQSLYFKQSGAWTQLTGSNLVDLINNQTIGGVKTFTQTIQGDISGTAGNVSGVVAVANGGTGASTAANARTNLGLGTIATQDASSVAITGGSITGITDLAVADGGTGASSASVARTNLGAVGLSDTQTLTNKTISGASNTLTNIPNASLDNDSVNVNGVDLTLGAVQLLGPDWILPSYAGNAGKVLAVNLSSSDVQWVAGGGVGSVTSIDVSGGTTGLTTSGGPITAAGVITLDGTLGIANGGTGQTTANAAFNALAPSQTSNSGKFLTTNGTDASWVTITGTISYQGTWNASTNTPTITSGVGVNGYYYVVSVAGSTNIDGITDWQIGDWLIFNGTAWQKIDQSNTVTSVAGRTGAVVLTTADIGGLGTIATQNANAVAITGGTATLTSLTVNDNTTLGSSNTDEVNFTARIASEFTPTTSNTYDLGRNSHEWRNLYLSGTANLSGGTANGVAYLNGSKVLTTGSALTFDGSRFFVNTSGNTGASVAAYDATASKVYIQVGGASPTAAYVQLGVDGSNGTAYLNDYYGSGLVFQRAGTEQMRLNSTGLGIGTSSPATKLQATIASGTAYTSSSTGNVLTISNSTASGYAGIAFNTEPSAGNAGIAAINSFAPASGDSVLAFSTRGSATLAERMRLDSSGNLGLGVTPSAWFSSERVIQVGLGSAFGGRTNNASETNVYANTLINSGGSAVYIADGLATRYAQDGGKHLWYTAPSGTAGDAISFTQAMTLDASSQLAINTTTIQNSSGGRGNITLGGSSSAIFNLSVASANSGSIYHSGSEMWFHNRANGPVLFFTNDTERARITSAGVLDIGTGAGAVGQIQFPATQVASANANTLDDYEEGTWTPTVVAITGTFTTVGTCTGKYVKIGQTVSVTYTVNVTTLGTGGTGFAVTNLPFTVGSATSDVAGYGVRANDGNQLVSIVSASSTRADTYLYTGGSPLVAGVNYRMCITYFTT